MIKIKLILVTFICSGCVSITNNRHESQILEKSSLSQSVNSSLYVKEKNGLFGYVNNDDKFIIQPIYSMAHPFSDGVAVVQKNGLFGAIDKNGKIKVPFKYIKMRAFREGVAAAKPLDAPFNWAYIWPNGKRASDYYDTIGDFNGGIAIVGIYDNTDKKNKVTEGVLHKRDLEVLDK